MSEESPSTIRHVRYRSLKTPAEIDNELKGLDKLLHQTQNLQLREVIRQDQDYLLDRRNLLVRKTKRGTRVPVG